MQKSSTGAFLLSSLGVCLALGTSLPAAEEGPDEPKLIPVDPETIAARDAEAGVTFTAAPAAYRRWSSPVSGGTK
jgi:hypothetical protein